MFSLNEKDTWARQAGLLPIRLDPTLRENKYIMLDGGFYDFCLDLTNSPSKREDYFSQAWSTNTKNYISLYNNDIVVYNWNLNSHSKLPVSIVNDKFEQFIQILNNNTYKTNEDLVPFIIGLFRKMRNLTCERDEPLEALNLLYKLLISINEDIYKIDCNKWNILDVNIPNQFDEFIETIRNGIRNIKPNLDLILRHCSGPLFQEAHKEVVMFNPNRDLFGNISPSLKFINEAYSSIHYTPQYLARSIVESVIKKIDLTKEKIKILDPACGSGAFLVETLKQLKELDYKGFVDIYGWDSSSSAVSTTKFLLHYEQSSQWGEEHLQYFVKDVQDSLQENWDNDYDIILMNPPFLSWELVKGNDSKDAIMHALEGVSMKKRPNQSAAFFYKAVNSLSHEGVLGVVLPSSILLSDQYSILREKVMQTTSLQVVARLGNYIFEDALTDVSFIIAQNKIEKYIPEGIWCKNKKGVAYEVMKNWRKMKFNKQPFISTEDYSVHTAAYFPIIKDSWNIIPMKDERYLESLKEYLKLGKLKKVDDIFNIYQGLLTGRKDVFEISLSKYESLSELEKKYYRPLISSGTINDGQIKINEYIWFPYNTNGLIINDEDSLQVLPNVWEQLVKNRNELEKRTSVKKWWELTRPRTWQFNSAFRLYSTRFGNSSSFGIGDRDDYVIEEGNAFEFKHTKYLKEDYYFYLSLFSSKTFEKLLSIYSKRIMAGYDLGKIQIKDIPIIDVNTYNFRCCDEYKKMVKIGKALSLGESYMKDVIDENISIFYPNYEDKFRYN